MQEHSEITAQFMIHVVVGREKCKAVGVDEAVRASGQGGRRDRG